MGQEVVDAGDKAGIVIKIRKHKKTSKNPTGKLVCLYQNMRQLCQMAVRTDEAGVRSRAQLLPETLLQPLKKARNTITQTTF